MQLLCRCKSLSLCSYKMCMYNSIAVLASDLIIRSYNCARSRRSLSVVSLSHSLTHHHSLIKPMVHVLEHTQLHWCPLGYSTDLTSCALGCMHGIATCMSPSQAFPSTGPTTKPPLYLFSFLPAFLFTNHPYTCTFFFLERFLVDQST